MQARDQEHNRTLASSEKRLDVITVELQDLGMRHERELEKKEKELELGWSGVPCYSHQRLGPVCSA